MMINCLRAPSSESNPIYKKPCCELSSETYCNEMHFEGNVKDMSLFPLIFLITGRKGVAILDFDGIDSE